MNKKQIEKLIFYESGNFFWKGRGIPYFDARFKGNEALCEIRRDGYLGGMVGGKRLLKHRVVWLFEKGNWPNGQIDHIDGNPKNNHIDNLRDVSNAQNSRNSRGRDGTSKYKGVYWRKDKSLWRVQLMVNGIRKNGGHYKSEVEAAKAYNKMAKEHFGKFARLNKL